MDFIDVCEWNSLKNVDQQFHCVFGNGNAPFSKLHLCVLSLKTSIKNEFYFLRNKTYAKVDPFCVEERKCWAQASNLLKWKIFDVMLRRLRVVILHNIKLCNGKIVENKSSTFHSMACVCVNESYDFILCYELL